MEEEAAKVTTSKVETRPLRELYTQLKRDSENNDDCTDTVQKIIDYSYNNAISETELMHHLT